MCEATSPVRRIEGRSMEKWMFRTKTVISLKRSNTERKSYEVSISAKMYDLEWLLNEIQGFLWQTFVKIVQLFIVFYLCDH